ncbi:MULTISPECIES: sensor histidine kinase [unclassified Methylobacterium]|uniref:sensor histidine kinase n=1 Tax=unclassified Methylobacterium TaxID=2615210 RepID=UPI0002E7A6B8|nr:MULTISPECIES: HAMP domain-containing sensor histidine kinase [Methylobacterium]WFT83658.1 HAMP domain-containing sensor histidine kinase [Methylobacterium nodulans]
MRERGALGAQSSRFGLSGRLLLLTILFVLIAEILIYVPSVANFRRTWLSDRVAAAQVAALVLDAAPSAKVSDDLARRLLTGVGARAIALRAGGTRRLITVTEMPSEVSEAVDLRESSWGDMIAGAWQTLWHPGEGPIRVVGHGMDGVDFVEILLDPAPLRAALIDFSWRILMTSMAISGITGLLVFLALQVSIVRPVLRLTRNIAAFADDPEDASRLIAPSWRRDEIGLAETALARMETVLAGELRQKRRLADLGLSVSKINHELRNLLTTAQLLGDRLEASADPAAQRVAPRLMATLDRAIRYCEATLAYGRAAERVPERRLTLLKPILADAVDLAGMEPGTDIRVVDRTPGALLVDADPDQLSRVVINLVRNAVQALALAGTACGSPPLVTLEGRRDGEVVTILIADNGPGLPERARANLFSPFQGSTRPGGTGLGLAIAAELTRLHGGTLSLDPTRVGARFRITVPDRA